MPNVSFPSAPSAAYPSFTDAGSPPSKGDDAASLSGQTSPNDKQLGNKGPQQHGAEQTNTFSQDYEDATTANGFNDTISAPYSEDASQVSSWTGVPSDGGIDQDADVQGGALGNQQTGNVRQETSNGRPVTQQTNFNYATNLPPKTGTNQNTSLAGQTVAQTVGQSINQDITQNLAGTQNFGGTADSGNWNLSNTSQNTSLDQAPLSDSGLTADQQVTSQNPRQQDSGAGSEGGSHSGNSEGKEVAYALGPKPSFTTVMSSQRGVGGAISTRTILSQLGKPGQTPLAQQGKSNIQYQNPLQLSHAATSYIADTLQAKTKGIGLGSFTLKMDPKLATLQTASSKAQTLAFINENRAPKLPSAPNVYAMITTAQELSTNIQGLTVEGMVDASNAMNLLESSEFATQIKDINNAIASSHKSNQKAKTAKIIGWVMNVSMCVVGALLIASGVGAGLGTALIIGGVMGCVMMSQAGTDITNSLTASLIKMGVPKKDASIVAQVIICVVMIACTMGAGGMASALGDAGQAAAAACEEAAVESAATTATSAGGETTSAASIASRDAAETTIEELTSNTTQLDEESATLSKFKPVDGGSASSSSESSSTVSQASKTADVEQAAAEDTATSTAEDTAEAPKKTYSRAQVFKALQTQTGRSAFYTNLGKSIASAPAAIASAPGSFASEAIDTASSTMQTLTDTLSLFAQRTATVCRAMLGEGAAEEGTMAADEATESEQVAARATTEATKQASTMAQMKALASSMNVFANPVRAALQMAELTQIGLGVASATTEYQAAKAEAEAAKASATVLISQASTTSLNEQIKTSNAQMNIILHDMNASIASTAGVLAGIVNDNPLSHLA